MFTLYKQRIGQYFHQHRVISIIAGHVVVMTALTLTLFGNSLGKSLVGAFADASCPTGDHAHAVTNGETLGNIAMSNNTTWQELAQHNHISNGNMIYPGQTICLPGKASGGQSVQSPAHPAPSNGPTGSGNAFPYGQCTYWADERYHRLYGVYVPWMTNSNAWQWTSRANEFRWNVSSTPTVGAILVLQSGVQGAGGYGHVAVVEKILDSGHVMTSNMNWGGGASVTYIEFAVGPGASFVTH